MVQMVRVLSDDGTSHPVPTRYRPDIDGLRAVAILPVVFFHVGITGISGGYVGVDVFFVISGYVIAQSLLSDLREGRFSVLSFYERRARRILPAFIVMAGACFLAALAALPPPDMADFSKSLAFSSAFASNIFFWKNSGYFEAAALTRPLLHTWSLSVEEQYYLFVPLLLSITYKYASRLMFAVFAVAAVVSLALCIFAVDKAPTASFFLLPTRAWELLLGALLVLKPAHRQLPARVSDSLGFLGAAFIVVSVVTYNDTTAFPGAAALLPTVGAALIILVGTDRVTPVSRLLSWRPLVLIGLVSYSLYLVHWPIIVFTRYATLKDPDLAQQCLIVLGSFTLAFLSWRFVERPFRRSGSFAPRPAILAASVIALAGVVALGALGVAKKGFAERYPDYVDAMQAARRTGGTAQSWKENVCFLQNQAADAWNASECVRTVGAQGNAVLWGDSFAAHYVPGLVANESRLSRNIIQYTFAGCPPILDYESYARPGCADFNRRIFEVVERFHADVVILSCRWDQVRTRGFGGLHDTVQALQKKGLRVFVIGQSPTYAFDVAHLAVRHAGLRPDDSAAWEISFDPAVNRVVADAAGASTYIDALSPVCSGRTCDYMRSASLLYFDYGHFTQIGSELAVRTYFPLFTRAPTVLAR
jgi:peptidoglycan/LPS O-acetylase OafA/YrhL